MRTDVVRERDNVALEERHAVRFAVVAREDRSRRRVDRQSEPAQHGRTAAFSRGERLGNGIRIAADLNAGERVPRFVERFRFVDALHMGDSQERVFVARLRGVAGREASEDDHCERSRPYQRCSACRSGAVAESAGCGERCDGEYGGRCVLGYVKQPDETCRAERGASEIDGVEPAHLRGEAGERKADGDPAEDKGHRDHEIGQSGQPDAIERPGRFELDVEMEDEAEHHCDAEEQRREGKLIWQPPLVEELG